MRLPKSSAAFGVDWETGNVPLTERPQDGLVHLPGSRVLDAETIELPEDVDILPRPDRGVPWVAPNEGGAEAEELQLGSVPQVYPDFLVCRFGHLGLGSPSQR